MGEFIVATKYAKNSEQAKGTKDFVRFDKTGSMVLSANIKKQILHWKRVDYYIDADSGEFIAKLNNESGLYSVFIGNQAKTCGISPMKIMGVIFGKRYSAKVEDDMIIVKIL
ncbi:hypothetical protein [Tepidibacillus marianensis]|uniref:hypothetical protein n=1 Tax=Tepidibacillus marianensis TaxID=3131995 RepID=UPI0030CCC9F1